MPKGQSEHAWPQETIDKAVTLFVAGYSPGVIAQKISGARSFTRNAVIGKLQRMGMSREKLAISAEEREEAERREAERREAERREAERQAELRAKHIAASRCAKGCGALIVNRTTGLCSKHEAERLNALRKQA